MPTKRQNILATYQHRVAGGQSRYPHHCPRCFERCQWPDGHTTMHGCRSALDRDAARALREIAVAHRAEVLSHRFSPGGTS